MPEFERCIDPMCRNSPTRHAHVVGFKTIPKDSSLEMRYWHKNGYWSDWATIPGTLAFDRPSYAALKYELRFKSSSEHRT